MRERVSTPRPAHDEPGCASREPHQEAAAKAREIDAAAIRAELRALADPQVAKSSQWFFKTAPGDYGYARGASEERERIFSRYLEHVPRYVNNWDLVDASAHHIVGAHLFERNRETLDALARSPHLWCRRVEIIAHDAALRDRKTARRRAPRVLDRRHRLINTRS